MVVSDASVLSCWYCPESVLAMLWLITSSETFINNITHLNILIADQERHAPAMQCCSAACTRPLQFEVAAAVACCRVQRGIGGGPGDSLQQCRYGALHAVMQGHPPCSAMS